MRDDIALLMDEGIIRLPVTTWPLPVADVRDAVERVDGYSIGSDALRCAARCCDGARVGGAPRREGLAHPGNLCHGRKRRLVARIWRARDKGKIRSVGGAANGRRDLAIAAERQFDPIGGHRIRFDGSHLTVRWGNRLFSANTMDRWYGPAEEGSLILSNNARPMPQISLDRMRSTRSSIPVLRWLGPWRSTAYFAVGESHRPDLSNPRFMGQRFTFQRLPKAADTRARHFVNGAALRAV